MATGRHTLHDVYRVVGPLWPRGGGRLERGPTIADRAFSGADGPPS